MFADGEKNPASCQSMRHIVFGILPFISAEQLVLRFSPLAKYLSEKTGVKVTIETAPDFKTFERRTQQDKRYDLLFTAPHFYPRAHAQAGYRLIVSVDSPGMWAIIVAPEKSDIHTARDLIGKRLATVQPAGLATILVRQYLIDKGINPDRDLELVVTPSHDASLLSSYHGVTDASALMSPPYEAADAAIRKSMRVIAVTQKTPHIPVSVGPGVNESCAQKIRQILLNISSSAEGPAVLQNNNFSGFKMANPEDYEKLGRIYKSGQ